MATTPEGRVKKQVKELLDKAGVWYFMPVQTGYGVSGIPDFLCCVRGVFLAIETKADAKREPTRLQVKRMEEIISAKGRTLVIHKDNLDTLEKVLNELTN